MPSTDEITFAVAVSFDQNGHAQLHFKDPSTLLTLPAAMQLRLITDAAPAIASGSTPPDPGTSAAQPLASPFGLRLVAFDLASGQPVALPASVLGSTIEVRLPLPRVDLAPGEEVTWLMELVGASGEFVGYVRPASHVDQAPQQLVLEVRADQLRGTLFLPVIWRTTYMRNFDPAAHIWSNPFADAVDFGVAAPQWTRMQVLAPPLSQRLLVLNAFTGQPGWVDAAGVGQVAADDGLSTVPVLNAAAENSTPDAVAEGAPAAPAPSVATYTVQPGDTLNHIAAQVDSTIAQLWAANPGIDPDSLVIGKELVVPVPRP